MHIKFKSAGNSQRVNINAVVSGKNGTRIRRVV